MKNYNKLKEKFHDDVDGVKNELNNLNKIAVEAKRVSKVARNANIIIEDIDRQFSQATKLNKVDISFLFFAVALQCIRQYILTNDTLRFADDRTPSNIAKKFAPIELTGAVPYDAVTFADKNTFYENIHVSGRNHRYTGVRNS
jgi:hypothetical protein